MRKYYFKATLDNMVSGYDPNFVHKMGHNKHPNPDRESKDVCGKGVHLARSIHDALSYVRGATEIYFATSTDIIGGDDSKVRVGEYDILFRISQGIVNDYQSKHSALYKGYQSKRSALSKDYQSKWSALDRDALYKGYQSKHSALDKDYQSKWDVLDKKTLQTILRLYAKETK